ncbi:hypothetical protein Tco_0617935 [Tanacetum coccineum]
MKVSLKSYVKDIFDRIDRNQQSNSMKISNIENLASKMSIQFSQLGAGNMKRIYESSIGVEIEKMNVETIALGSRKCEFGQELEKVQIAHNPFDETPKENFEVVHKRHSETVRLSEAKTSSQKMGKDVLSVPLKVPHFKTISINSPWELSSDLMVELVEKVQHREYLKNRGDCQIQYHGNHRMHKDYKFHGEASPSLVLLTKILIQNS